MGIIHVAAALKLPMKSASAKVVLIALANHANDDDGFCWIGQETMQLYTCLSERTVRSALRELEDQGILSTKRRKQATSIHHLSLIHPRPADIAALDVEKILQDRQLPQPRPATVAPEPEDNQNIPRARASKVQSDARADGLIPADWKPDEKLTAWFDAKHPTVDMEDQVQLFISRNRANETQVKNIDEAFKGWCGRITGLRHPPKPRTKKAETEQNWQTPEARRAHLRKTIALYRRMGRDEEADTIERQINHEENQ